MIAAVILAATLAIDRLQFTVSSGFGVWLALGNLWMALPDRMRSLHIDSQPIWSSFATAGGIGGSDCRS